MSVVADAVVRYYPFPGFEDPSLPAGSWAGVVVILGDASGGTRIGNLDFAPSGQAISSRMFSMEQVAISDEDNSAGNATINSIAMGKAGDINFDSFFATVAMIGGPTFGTVDARDLEAFKGVFLGRQNRNSVATSLRITKANSDGDNLIFQAEGYWWDSRSLNVRGGPSRPARGMYR